MTFDSRVQARVRVPAAVQHHDPGDVRGPAAHRGVVADPGPGTPPPALAQPTSVITPATVFSDSDIFFFAFNIQRAFHLSLLL